MVRTVEVSEEASKATVFDAEEQVKEGDIVEIKREKLAPLEPLLKRRTSIPAEETRVGGWGSKLAKGSEDSYFELFASSEGKTDFYLETKDTNGNVVFQKSKYGTISPHWVFGMGGGGPVISRENMRWLADMYFTFAVSPLNLKNNSSQDFINYYFYLIPITLGVRIYPFTPLIVPDYQNYESAREQRGWLVPYMSIAGNFNTGIFHPDTTSKYYSMEFLLGIGGEARAGIELFNVMFVEFIYRFGSSTSTTFDLKNSNGIVTGKASYEFKLDTTGIGFGFRF